MNERSKRPPLKMPIGFQINAARAKESQPPLRSIQGESKAIRNWENSKERRTKI